MRILLVTNELKRTSGWARYGFELANVAIKNGHEVRAAVQSVDATNPIRQSKILSPPLKYLADPFTAWSTASRIDRIIREYQPDVVHFIVEPYIQILPFMGKMQARTVLTIHGSYGALPEVTPPGIKRLVCSQIYKRALGRVGSIMSVSAYTKTRFMSVFPQYGGKVTVVNSGSSLLPKPTPEQVSEFKHRHGLESKNPILLTVGAIKKRKGQLDTLRAAGLLATEYPNLMYVMVGSDKDGSYVDSIRTYASENGLEKNCLILNSVASDEELACAYAACDVFLLNSNNVGPYFEGFGLVILEANSFGKPAIGSRGCGIEDAIKDGVNGFLVEQGNEKEIAEAINKAIKEQLDQEIIMNHALKHAWHDVLKRYEKDAYSH